jgi:hypothetical protein
LDLVRIGRARLVTTVKNLDFFASGWSRFDPDMLRCFEGRDLSSIPMFHAQREVLALFFTRSELRLMRKALFPREAESLGA